MQNTIIWYWFLLRVLYFKTFLLLFVTVSRKYSRTPLRIYDIVITYDLNMVILLRIVAFLKVFCMFLNKVILYGQKMGRVRTVLATAAENWTFSSLFFLFSYNVQPSQATEEYSRTGLINVVYSFDSFPLPIVNLSLFLRRRVPYNTINIFTHQPSFGGNKKSKMMIDWYGLWVWENI